MKYLLKFVGDSYTDLYYSHFKSWGGVLKVSASKLTHKEARKIQSHLRQPRLGLKTILESVDPTPSKKVKKQRGNTPQTPTSYEKT